MKKLILSAGISLLFIGLMTVVTAKAAPVMDHDLGTYTDDFANISGLATQSVAGVDVSDGKIKLTNASSTFSAPYRSSGYVITNTIAPLRVVEWGTLQLTATIPTSTSITVQVLDGSNYVFADAYLSGNSSGFASTTLDLSSLPVMINGNFVLSAAKVMAIRFKITLTTSDPDFTPEINDLSFDWTLKSLNLPSAVGLSTEDFPSSSVDSKSSSKVGSYLSDYQIVASASSQESSKYMVWGPLINGNNIVLMSAGPNPEIYSFNKDNLSINWEKDQTAYFSPGVINSNGIIFDNDIYYDVVYARDVATGDLKWNYALYGGHNNIFPVIDSAGIIYFEKHGTGSGTSTIYAFESDGDVLWSKSIKPFDASGEVTASNIVVGTGGDLYIAFSNGDNDLGEVASLDKDDGTVLWEYPTDFALSYYLSADADGVVYTSEFSFFDDTTAKKIYAINPDGSLNWSVAQTEGQETLGWIDKIILDDVGGSFFSFVSDVNTNTYLVEKRSLTNGALLDSYDVTTDDGDSATALFADGEGGVYVSVSDFTEGFSARTTRFIYFDENLNPKFKVIGKDYQLGGERYQNFIPNGNLAMDDEGSVYFVSSDVYDDGSYNINYDSTGFKLAKMSSWTLSASTDKTAYAAGEAVNLSVTTSMPEANPLTGGANKMQVVLGDDSKTSLSYSTSNGANHIWTGSFITNPSMFGRTNSYTIEASGDNIVTDITTHFTSPATNSDNTGLTATSTFYVGSASSGTTNPDTTPPTSEITSTSNKKILGRAKDTGGSSIQKVEISLDNGSNWTNTNITSSDNTYSYFEYSYSNLAVGTYQVKTRATDWIGNIETPSSSTTLIIGQQSGGGTTIAGGVPTTNTTTTTTTTPNISSTLTSQQMQQTLTTLRTQLIQLLLQLLQQLQAQLKAITE